MSILVVEILWNVSITLLLCMSILWAVSVKIKKACIIDCFWGMGFVIVSWMALYIRWTHEAEIHWLHWQLFICVHVWGLRLTKHLTQRFMNKEQEDFRYQNMRKHRMGYFHWWSLIAVFYLQGILLILISSPLWISFASSHHYSGIHGFALVIYLIGLYLEWEADRSLRKAKKQGVTLLTQGVWSLSRHPNYLGDACVWWGIALMAYQSPYGWIALLSAVLMNFLLLKVSGVPLLEKHMAQKEGWKEYCEKTPIFWPNPLLLLKKRN